MLLILDTKTGNLQSVANAFRRIGAAPEIAQDVAQIAQADALVLPGVGAFEPAMAELIAQGAVEPLRRRVLGDRVPLLGICLGMQLLADASEEMGKHAGLGFVGGRVVRLDPAGSEDRVPNFGWHDVMPTRPGVLFPEPNAIRSFYFAHSYHFRCTDHVDSAATIGFGGRRVIVVIERGNVFGAQFHPEKSQDAGLDVLHRFMAHATCRIDA